MTTPQFPAHTILLKVEEDGLTVTDEHGQEVRLTRAAAQAVQVGLNQMTGREAAPDRAEHALGYGLATVAFGGEEGTPRTIMTLQNVQAAVPGDGGTLREIPGERTTVVFKNAEALGTLIRELAALYVVRYPEVAGLLEVLDLDAARAYALGVADRPYPETVPPHAN